MELNWAASGLLFTVLAAIAAWLVRNENRLTKVESNMNVFWKVLDPKMADMLKSYPTHLDKDVLLDKFKNKELSLHEAQVLRTILDEELRTNGTSDIKSFAYIMILARIEQVIEELGKRKSR